MNKFRQILQQGVKLASEGRLEDALRKFNEGLTLFPNKADERWVCLIHKNVALIHERNEDLLEAKSSFLKALEYDDGDPYTYFSLAELSERLSEETAARQYFSRCHELALQKDDKDLLEMLVNRGHK